MKRPRPGVLAVRAVNQYRRRDVLTYLGLRYYLENSAARSDEWARRVATDLVHTRADPPYLRAYHFKDVSERGQVSHRAMFLPGANEALAEAALLDECARHPEAFANPRCVFSHELSDSHDRTGVFQHYINGLRSRHAAIAKAADEFPDGVVRYADVKQFYPTIGSDLAMNAWRTQSALAHLPKRYLDLGEKLINDHARVVGSGKAGILTGPMLSHLLANLVLRELDLSCSNELPVRYFRYVDDITLVGDADAVAKSLKTVRGRLSDLGLKLHEDGSAKSIEVPTAEWLKGRNDFRDSRRPISWMTLIGDLKRFLLTNPVQRDILRKTFRLADIRIPVRDYTASAHERGFLERMQNPATWQWFRRKSQAVSIQSLLHQATWLCKSYEAEFRSLIESTHRLKGYERKRNIPKLRYRAGRLIYLAGEDTLGSLSAEAASIPELHYHTVVMAAVARANIDDVLSLGTNAAQAAAQPLRISEKAVALTRQDLGEPEQQALAIFLLNGVRVTGLAPTQVAGSELMRFAAAGADRELMKSADPFLRELACLHGLAPQPRHSALMDEVFDADEELAFDAVDQLQQSVSP